MVIVIGFRRRDETKEEKVEDGKKMKDMEEEIVGLRVRISSYFRSFKRFAFQSQLKLFGKAVDDFYERYYTIYIVHIICIPFLPWR